MRRRLLTMAMSVGIALLWSGGVLLGTLEGWWRRPLAPPDDPDAFMRAATELVDSTSEGNAVLVLLDGGRVVGDHAVSVGEVVDVNSVFQVASLSKWVTAWGVMTLVERGEVDLDAPVQSYLTRWTIPESAYETDSVTVRRLLSHTAGLIDGLGYAGFGIDEPLQTVEASLVSTADASPGAHGVVEVGREPGAGWLYSGGGYTILQLLVEEVSGTSFEAYLQRAVLQPLGMTRSSFMRPLPDASALAASYDVEGIATPYRRFTAVAAASLYTTAADLTRLLQAHVPGPDGEPVGRGVLHPETLEEMRRPHGWQLGAAIWGLGTMLYAPSPAGGFVIGHDGDNEPAINTAARIDPRSGDGIIVLETGNDLLATTVAGEWVFWATGTPDFLDVTIAAPGMLRTIGLGAGLIVLVGFAVAWRVGRRRRGPVAS